MNANEQDDFATRAAGDVMTKSASEASADKSVSEKPTDSESGTRAGGDVIIKGASQKQPEDKE